MSRFDDDDDDIETTAPKTEVDETIKAEARRIIKRGWGNAEQTKQADSQYAQRLKIEDNPVIVKFLEDEPYASYRQHWVERPGQKSFTCLNGIHPQGCPLCDAGHRASARFSFNVALLVDGEVVLKSYDVGPRVIDSLKNFHQDPRQGPLSKNYWAISRSGKGPTSQTNHQLIRERDLTEDWNTSAPDESQLAALKSQCYTESIIPIPSRKTLSDIAVEDLGRDD